uniref:PX domain-containing protein n=1 Tax=Alexandrium monilatum TaxID=311494 RepID=A0A7S4UBV6_9DINO
MSAAADSSGRYTVKFVGNKVVDGHTAYIIKVTNADGETWNIQKRYSDMRMLHEELSIRHGDSLPLFPGKRLFNNQDPSFVATRQAGLQNYLDSALQIEREPRTPALRAFIGEPSQQDERTTAKEYKKILETMQSRLLNLALPPAPLDEEEVMCRNQKYTQVMKAHIHSQPVDPIHLRAPGFDSEPLPLCSANAEHLDTLKAPPSSSDSKILNSLLDDLQQVLRPDPPIADKDKLTASFPDVPLPAAAAVTA